MVGLSKMPEATHDGSGGRNIGLGLRLAVCVGLVILLLVSVAATLANVVRSRSPELALRLAPWNGPAAAQQAQQLLFRDPTQKARVARLSQRALRRDPTLVAAITTRGAIEEAQGRTSESRRDFLYATWLSRRHLPTELWWIEYGAAQGNVGLTLAHYDIALRAIRQAPDILFPILGGAIGQPDIRNHLLPLLRAAPPWRTPFFQWLATNGVDYPSTALLLAALWSNKIDLPQPIYGQVENGLIQQKDYLAAWNLYRTRHPGVGWDMAQDANFKSAGSEYRSPFDWNIVEGHGEAVIGQSNGKFVLSFFTNPATAGQLARQMTVFRAGRYTLHDTATLETGSGGARPYWLVQCVDGRKLGSAPVGQNTAPVIEIPSDCPAQWIILASDFSDASEGVEGRIQTIVLQRSGDHVA